MNETMSQTNWRSIALQVLVLLAIAFGALAWTQRPEGALVWMTGMLAIPVMWLLVVAFGAMPDAERTRERKTVFNSLIGGALMICGALGACALGTLGAIEEEWITRYGMIVVALSLVITGNGLPKKPGTDCGPGRGVAVKRLVGWTFVITGLLQILAWLFLPMEHDIVFWATGGIYAGMVAVLLIGVPRLMAGRHART